MTSPEHGMPATMRAVAEALGLPQDARAGFIAARFADQAERSEAVRLLRACERAAEGSVLDTPAVQLATPLVEAVEKSEPEALSAALAGRYAIEKELGRGGQATVYLAHDERHRRPVALKVLHGAVLPGSGPSRGAAWFRREIELTARLAHPHIIPVHDSGVAARHLFYVTPYVDGQSLRDRLRSGGRLPLDSVLRILRDVCRALAYAHRHGVVHRDIKPGNILLSHDGDALVGDFGIARAIAAAAEPSHGEAPEPATSVPDSTAGALTGGGIIVGTPAYMSPEQAAGAAVIDHRADLYALGVVAYELLAGAPPFAGDNRDDLLDAHRFRPPVPLKARDPDVPQELATLVDCLIAKRPGDRPKDAASVLGVLDDALGGLLLTSRRTRPANSPSQAAITLYQKGRFFLGMRHRDSLLSAIQYLERAVALEPTYARAHAAVGDAYAMLGVFGHEEPREAFSRCRAAAERALAIDPHLPEAHATLAHIAFVYEWDWQAAGPALDRAIELDPGYPTARMYHASYLHSVGRHDDALAELSVASALDPLHPAAILSGRIYVDTQRPHAAIEILRELIELDPRRDLAHELLAHAYIQTGEHEEAVASMSRAAELSGARDSAQLAYVYAMAGEPEEAHRVLARLMESGARLDLLGFHLGMACAGLGEADQAFDWLEAAYRERGGFMNLLAVSYGFDNIRSDRRFADLLQRMGLGAARR